jgi:hypothetical protein
MERSFRQFQNYSTIPQVSLLYQSTTVQFRLLNLHFFTLFLQIILLSESGQAVKMRMCDIEKPIFSINCVGVNCW